MPLAPLLLSKVMLLFLLGDAVGATSFIHENMLRGVCVLRLQYVSVGAGHYTENGHLRTVVWNRFEHGTPSTAHERGAAERDLHQNSTAKIS